MIVDLAALQRLIEEQVVKPLDHTFLNKDIPYFAQVVPTAENIALYIQRLLTLPLRELGVQLHRVRLQESPNNSSEVYGEFPLEELLNSSEGQDVASSASGSRIAMQG
jgi:6-pyruvoyltetrahydropterin/6-carboxytetrahydropterin synthase